MQSNEAGNYLTLNTDRSYQITGKDQCGGLIDDTYTIFKTLDTQRTSRPVGISSAAFSPHCSKGISSRLPPLLLGSESGGVLFASLEELEWTPLLPGVETF